MATKQVTNSLHCTYPLKWVHQTAERVIKDFKRLTRTSKWLSGQRSVVIMAVRRFSTSSQSFLKFYNVICAMFVILNWRCLLIIPRNDFVPSEMLGMLTDWTGANVIPQAFVTWLVTILDYYRVVDVALIPVYCFVARAFLGL